MTQDTDETALLINPTSPTSNYGLIPFSDLNFASSVVEGEVDEHRTSPVRRTFLLGAFFDFLIIAIIWFIYTKSLPYGLKENLELEVVGYTFPKSLFDNVISALIRFLWTLIFYFLGKSNKIYWQAFNTLATNIFVVVKIIYLKGYAGLEFAEYAQLVLNFIVPWIQTMFLDCRVFPQEKAANRNNDYRKLINEEGMRSNRSSSYYRSIYGSPNGSISTDFHNINMNHYDIEFIKKLTTGIEIQARKLYNNKKWKSWEVGDRELVQHLKIAPVKEKIFRLDGIINATPRAIIREMTDGVDATTVWNPLIDEMRRIESFQTNSDIVYTKTKDLPGGIISSRDFVILRKWYLHPDGNELSYIVGSSIEHPFCPTKPNVTRAFQSVNHVFIRSIEGEIPKSHMTIMLATDLCGWLPAKFVDQGTMDSMKKFYHNFNKQMKTYSVPVKVSAFNNEADP